MERRKVEAHELEAKNEYLKNEKRRHKEKLEASGKIFKWGKKFVKSPEYRRIIRLESEVYGSHMGELLIYEGAFLRGGVEEYLSREIKKPADVLG